MRNPRLLFPTLALSFLTSAAAQTSIEKDICTASKLGSVDTAGKCYSYKVKTAEKIWLKLVESDAKERGRKYESQTTSSGTAEWMYDIIKAEAKSWRAHLRDKCMLDAAGTAGMLQWDYAYALDCEARGLQARILEIRKSNDVN